MDEFPAGQSPLLRLAVQRVLLDEATIARRVQELGAAISEDYSGRVPILVGVLKGVVPFMADLLRAITVPVEVDFMAISRYRPGEKGTVRVLKDLDASITGRDVIFVEDIVDTGLTLRYLLRLLRAREPATLEVCTLLSKTARRLVQVPLRYVGFEVPDLYLVGYGLDHRERYRNLPHVGILRSDLMAKSKAAARGSGSVTGSTGRGM